MPLKPLAVLALLLVLLAGCGEGGEDGPAGAESTSLTSTPPPGEPANTPVNGPPPAWVETSQGPQWLAFSSYCWGSDGRAICADSVAPSCGSEFTPTIEVQEGETVTLHLGFEPRQAALSYVEQTEAGASPVSRPLGSEQTAEFTVSREGAFVVFAPAEGGNDASYAGCFEFAS